MPKANQKILVVAAHPDDEVLGCGGTILKHTSLGDEVSVLILGDGETSRDGPHRVVEKREQAKKAAELLGVKELFFEGLPDNQFDSVPLLQIVKTVEKYLSNLQPKIVYTHNPGDLNIDHQLAFQAVLTACRPQPGYFVKKILSFEVLSSTEWQAKKSHLLFCPNYYNDITGFLDKKIEALGAYGQELKQYPHPRSKEGVEVLAKYRGMESGLNFAEAFEVVRELSPLQENL